MRKITVVTTFPPHAYETYAKRMLENFEQNWPKDIQLLCYYEQNKPDVASDRIEYRDLEALAPQLVDFKESSIVRLPRQYRGKRLGHLWSISWVADNINLD